MTILFPTAGSGVEGFETNDFTTWTSTTGTPSVVASPVHHGSYAARLVYNYNAQRITKNIADTYTTVFFRAYISYLTTVPASYAPLMSCVDDNYNLVWQLMWKNDTLRLTRYYPATVSTTWSNAFSADTYYCFEVKTVENASTGEYLVYVDGTKRITDAGLDTSGIDNLVINNLGYSAAYGDSTPTIYYDCVVIADAYIGPESAGVTYSPKTRSSLPNTMVAMLNSKMLFG
jgi:hypothetical protein